MEDFDFSNKNVENEDEIMENGMLRLFADRCTA